MTRWFKRALQEFMGGRPVASRRSAPSNVPELAANAVAAGRRLRCHAQRIDSRVAAALRELERIYKSYGGAPVIAEFDDLRFLMELGDALREEAERLTVKGWATPYCISSRFLSQCLADLVKDSGGNEKLHFVTGPEVGPFKVLGQIINFPMKYQTAVGACGELRSTHEKLIELDEWGHALHAIFHSHPGTGPSATRPSDTDRNTQGRFERGGYLCIGGIFTRDGYVRFFSVKHRFRIYIHGKGVEEIEDNLYRLKTPESL